MKLIIIFFVILGAGFSQSNEKISTMDFVKILNNNKEETLYYYHNNWKQLRIKAIEKGYISQFQLLETKASKDAAFEIVLITTYPNKKQFDLREKNFQSLIKERGGLLLLNEKKPSDFRKVIFGKEKLKHLE